MTVSCNVYIVNQLVDFSIYISLPFTGIDWLSSTPGQVIMRVTLPWRILEAIRQNDGFPANTPYGDELFWEPFVGGEVESPSLIPYNGTGYIVSGVTPAIPSIPIQWKLNYTTDTSGLVNDWNFDITASSLTTLQLLLHL